MPIFVDTNIFLYALDPRDPRKQALAQQWLVRCWRERTGRTSIQVVNELYVNLARLLGRERRDIAREEARRLLAWRPRPVDEGTLETAWNLQDGADLSHWDSLILASAIEQDCTTLLTEDLQAGRVIGGVAVVDPFAAGAEI